MINLKKILLTIYYLICVCFSWNLSKLFVCRFSFIKVYTKFGQNNTFDKVPIIKNWLMCWPCPLCTRSVGSDFFNKYSQRPLCQNHGDEIVSFSHSITARFLKKLAQFSTAMHHSSFSTCTLNLHTQKTIHQNHTYIVSHFDNYVKNMYITVFCCCSKTNIGCYTKLSIYEWLSFSRINDDKWEEAANLNSHQVIVLSIGTDRLNNFERCLKSRLSLFLLWFQTISFER